MKYELSGMPKGNQPLFMENYGTLLTMPWFQYVDIEEAKMVHPYYKYLLDNAPIVGDKKKVLVTAKLQYLTPDSLSIHYADDWHVDGNITGEFEDRMHLLISPCTATTKFNTMPTTLEVDELDYLAVNNQIFQKRDHMEGHGIAIKHSRFYTFDKSHAHRAVHPKQPEFRFMMRIIETDWFEGDKYFTHETKKYFINKEGNLDSTWSIRREPNGIQINPF